jgi:chemotaxis signal transduction protein
MSIDRNDLRARAEVAEARAGSGGRDAIDAVLQARAAALAASGRRNDPEPGFEALELTAGRETFLIELPWLREVLALGEWTPLPGIRSWIAGAIHFRGEIISVLDLPALLGSSAVRSESGSVVVVLASPSMTFGLLADAVAGVVTITNSELQAGSAVLSTARNGSKYLKGVTADGRALLDAARLLGDETLVVRDEHTAGLDTVPAGREQENER